MHYKKQFEKELKEFLLQLGHNIRNHRKRLNLTQEELHIKTGICQKTISLIENGHMNVTIKQLARIASVFNVTLIELLKKYR
ncbi:helix-turn-helix domain-containing protein [Commensalibacter melissae]|uniref:helix-turn-helix domain-containing protein n=1 Tax=Commensalibacter melissae TaxID=2070537 RepID=UPI0012D93850|nr:helix-turn-helix transcriptional regulator [Commensalibacter melissae]